MAARLRALLRRIVETRATARAPVVRPHRFVPHLFAAGVFIATGMACSGGPGRVTLANAEAAAQLDTIEKLGEALFFDPILSKNKTQACATCHNPDAAFTDPRAAKEAGRAVSLGDDGTSIGDRNTPTAAYARFSPPFHINAEGKPTGGYFHDGRAKTLEDQAAGPPLNPIEMAMPDKASVVARLKDDARYAAAFEALYGKGVLDKPDTGYAALTKSIAAFERTDFFAPFDSKYDRYLRGEVKLTDEEELGRTLFFSNQFTNCALCHKLNQLGGAANETFSNYQFHNIGTPANTAVRKVNGTKKGHIDHGLKQNPAAAKKAHDGKFKVPTLRNVAVTGPYMHNGVFNDLKTVVLFYDKYNNPSAKRQVNPETGKPWDPPEVGKTLSMKELKTGPGLDDKRINALVAFLKTLTDKRYEPLLK
jgi:cytochrome c peroxidase